jgi:hypothetical protein
MPLPPGPVVGTCGFGYPGGREKWRGRFYRYQIGERLWPLTKPGTPARGSSPPGLEGWFWCHRPLPPEVVLQGLARPRLEREPARRGCPRAAPGRQLHPAGHPGR